MTIPSNFLIQGQIVAGAASNILTTATGMLDLTKGTVSGEAPGDVLVRGSTNWGRGAGPIVDQFRLTLATGVPIATTDQTAKTTLYCTPYVGNRMSLYDGSNWVTYTSAEFSLALGTLTSGKPYDVFCYASGSTPTLEFLVWTNDTTRATALTRQDGVLVKSGTATRRYLGTFYTTSTTTTEDSEANRYVYNFYNQVIRRCAKTDSTYHTYASSTIRQWAGSTAHQVNMMLGDAASVAINLLVELDTNSTNDYPNASVGLDSTTTFIESLYDALIYSGTTRSDDTTSLGLNSSMISAGKHSISVNERSIFAGTIAFTKYALTVGVSG